MLLEPPPCAHCGQPMTERTPIEPEWGDYECKPCWFTVGPLSWMSGENRGMVVFSSSHYTKDGPKYSFDDLPHMPELMAWVQKYVIEAEL